MIFKNLIFLYVLYKFFTERSLHTCEGISEIYIRMSETYFFFLPPISKRTKTETFPNIPINFAIHIMYLNNGRRQIHSEKYHSFKNERKIPIDFVCFKTFSIIFLKSHFTELSYNKFCFLLFIFLRQCILLVKLFD